MANLGDVSLRDYYAAHALQGLLACGALEKMWAPNEEAEDREHDEARIVEVREELCRRAFLLADDMMRVRSRGTG